MKFHKCRPIQRPKLDEELRKVIERLDADQIYYPNDPSKTPPEWVKEWLAEEWPEDQEPPSS